MGSFCTKTSRQFKQCKDIYCPRMRRYMRNTIDNISQMCAVDENFDEDEEYNNDKPKQKTSSRTESIKQTRPQTNPITTQPPPIQNQVSDLKITVETPSNTQNDTLNIIEQPEELPKELEDQNSLSDVDCITDDGFVIFGNINSST